MPTKPKVKAYVRQQFKEWLPNWEQQHAAHKDSALYNETLNLLKAYLKNVNQLLFRTPDDAIQLELTLSTHAEQTKGMLFNIPAAFTEYSDSPIHAIFWLKWDWKQVEELANRFELRNVADAFANFWVWRCCIELAAGVINRYDMDAPEPAPNRLVWNLDTRSLAQLLLELKEHGYLDLPTNVSDIVRDVQATFTPKEGRIVAETLRKYFSPKPTSESIELSELLKEKYPLVFKEGTSYFFPNASNQKKRIPKP